MKRRTGHKPGHEARPPGGLTWADYLASLVESHGTLTAVAWKLVERGGGPDDVASVERALRRLRARGQRDGGSWGQRLVRQFGAPASVEARLRWMGLYHSPFNDLPRSVCLDQLRVWDRPPVTGTRARLWLQLGFASVALRGRAFAEADAFLAQARVALAGAEGFEAARVEWPLVAAYAASHAQGTGDVAERVAEKVAAFLDEAERALASTSLEAGDAACFRARLVDQRAFTRNRARDHEGAFALYDALPRADVHPFASYRRDAGLAFGHHRAGRVDDARAAAARACDHAGDGGYTRLRVMGLIMRARVDGADDAVRHLERAHAIATRLEDDELLARVARVRARHA